jgi:hypothetical protein
VLPRPVLRVALLLAGLGLAACTAPQPLVIAKAFVPGNIIARGVRGEVRTSAPGAAAETVVQNNFALRQVCTVRTGPAGAVTLIFSNATLAELGPQTEIVVETFTQIPSSGALNPEEATEEPTSSVTRITLVHGRLSGRVPKLHTVTGSSFVIHTPTGDREFNGTIFDLSAP